MEVEMYNDFLRDIVDIEAFQDFNKDSYPSKGEKIEKSEKQRFNPLFVLSEDEFKAKYRFSKDNMRRIIDLIKDDLDNTDTITIVRKRPQVPIDLQVMAALRLWGNTEHPLMTAYQHGVSSRTLARICKHVSAALASKASFHIRMPATLSEKEAAIHAFQSLAGNGSKMTNVIGAVEHHSVRFRRQAEPHKNATNSLDISNNSNDEQIHIQIVSDAFCKIRDIDCKLRNVNDSNDANETFMSSRIKERFEQNEFRGRILLGGEALSCTSYLFTPIEFPGTYKEKTYNRTHSATIAPAEQCLSMLKNRFSILNSEIASTFGTARNTIVALAVLHNLAIDWGANTNLEYTLLESFMNNEFNCPAYKNFEANARMEFIKNHF